MNSNSERGSYREPIYIGQVCSYYILQYPLFTNNTETTDSWSGDTNVVLLECNALEEILGH